MRNVKSYVFALCAALLLAVFPASPRAQTQASAAAAHGAAPFSPLRLPDGHPDMQGLWLTGNDVGFNGLLIGLLNGPNTFAFGAGAPPPGTPPTAGGRGPGGAGPGSGGPPPISYLPAYAGMPKDRVEHHAYADPEAHCHLPGVPRNIEQPGSLYPYQIIQDEKYVTILFEYVHDARIIPIDAGPHPENYRAWDGDSRGHWDGDTLVVDVRNFADGPWLSGEGDVIDVNAHVTEKFTLIGPDTIAYEGTVEDPTVMAKPWTSKFTIKRVAAKEQILEYSCVEGERDTRHYTEPDGGKQKRVQ